VGLVLGPVGFPSASIATLIGAKKVATSSASGTRSMGLPKLIKRKFIRKYIPPLR